MPDRARQSLVALLLAVLALGVAWTFVTPAWQAPDENSHFGYVQYLAETGDLPGRKADAPVFSTEQAAAADASNADLAAAQHSITMSWDAAAFRRFLHDDARFGAAQRSDAGGPNPAANNPPLYYLVEAPFYLATKGASIFARLEALRLASLLWLLVAVVATWLLAGEVLGRRPLLQLQAAGVVGLAPMTLFISSSVSPDSMLFAAWAIVFWLGARMLQQPASVATIGSFALAVGAACVVKATSYALAPAALLAVVLTLRRSGLALVSGRALRLGVVAGAALVATLGVWLIAARVIGQPTSEQVASVTSGGGVNVREFFSYVWQFYLPKTPLQNNFASLAPTIPVWDFLIKGSIASFGWTEVEFDAWVYWIVLAIGIAIAVGAIAGIWADRRRVDVGVLAFFALAALTLMAGLHVTEYRQLTGGAANFFQGRYVLPLAPLAGLAAARASLWVADRRRGIVVGSSLALLVVLNLFSLGLVLARFYA